jgi:type VI secretion system secreted protein Hcp
MALTAYLTLKGEKQGQIKGSVTQRGRENTIAVTAASHEIVSPRDAASGLPTGKRQHKPLTLTKDLDRSSPQLYAALAANERLTEFLLQFFRTERTGTEKLAFTIKLTNASISGAQFTMPSNEDPDLARRPEYEQVSFIYEKIEWTWVEGSITASDTWLAPNV